MTAPLRVLQGGAQPLPPVPPGVDLKRRGSLWVASRGFTVGGPQSFRCTADTPEDAIRAALRMIRVLG